MADAKLTALSELSVPSLDDLAYIVDDPSGTAASYKVAQNRLGGMYSPATCQGRLTTESGVPVSTSDRTAQSTIYFTPYQGDRVALYDGTRWKLYAFTQRSLALSGLTSAKPYDVFLYDNAGTLTLELTAWTSDTARATALVAQDGVWVKTGATTRRYVGTIYTTSATTTEDSLTNRYVWNAQNAVARPLRYNDPVNTHSYATGSYRLWNLDTNAQLSWVCGIETSAVALTGSARLIGASNSARALFASLGLDSTTAVASATIPLGLYNSTGTSQQIFSAFLYTGYPGIGRHFLALIESGGDGTSDFGSGILSMSVWG